MPTVGSAQDHFELSGRRIHADGAACRADDGTLAGSNLDMAMALRHAVRLLGLSLPDASRLASANPARFLGRQNNMGELAPGRRADLVHLGEDLSLKAVWLDGRPQD